MKKIFSVFVLSLTLGTSSLCATESIKIQSPSMQNTALTQAEMAFLFDSSDVNVITLSDEEMALTQGEGFVATTIATAVLMEVGKDVYKWVKGWKIWRR
ncbi:hypothetical protein LS68_006460 [Helicobacter sp. MIT 05-5293]|uniref:hypothetical protein n=1 Tax=Helicobacter sp. MIT 05-5293 TaxID=1548149 RepID=UPI00051DF41E|nr:hypothetical protein [Helicobacter sp. MIT 05-5293]TLD80398.1 hypothetical protein LS68_006460 [Helicobacter sp. MIT 05-5293]